MPDEKTEDNQAKMDQLVRNFSQIMMQVNEIDQQLRELNTSAISLGQAQFIQRVNDLQIGPNNTGNQFQLILHPNGQVSWGLQAKLDMDNQPFSVPKKPISTIISDHNSDQRKRSKTQI